VNRSVNFKNQTHTFEPPSRFAWLRRLFFRLFLLGVAGSAAAVAGIIWGMANPQASDRPPLVVAAWEWLQAARQGQSQESESAPGDHNLTLPLLQLTEAEQQQLKTQLKGLTTEFNSLSDRAQELEMRLGMEENEQPLAERLQRLQQTLQGSSPSANASENEGKNSLVKSDRVKVTLPTDVLFEDNVILSADASAVLDTIAAELGRYPGATIRIAVHADATDNPDENRARTFRQSSAIKEYLAQGLSDRYRWVAIGYGHTRPLVPNDNDGNRQRNRRVEITAD